MAQAGAFANCSLHRQSCPFSQLPAPRRPLRNLVVRAATALPAEYKQVAPAGSRVFVKVESGDEKSTGGILLPSTAQKKPTEGRIVNAGTAGAVKNGDKVVYSKFAGTEVELEGAEHVLLKEEDVIGVLSSDDIADLKPLGDRILIEVAEADEATKGGVILSTGGRDKPTIGKVVAVGSGKADDSGNIVKPTTTSGSSVLYQRYSGSEFEGKTGRSFIVVREADILAALS
ncbi:hypothetical protein WJX84_005169 [Apatococcus fuscideae]|uniref:20 kDa chaperonin, chloroplastic n=1 Tax=Apatococcus fuscideae TaxID=2026836 RepID=A0AAW1SQA6_9CHLO